jgi:hypothetical protein
LWLERADITHYIDPRNNLGAQWLQRYATEVLADPAAFVRELDAQQVDIVLVPIQSRSFGAAARALNAGQAWPLVYWDGWYAVHVRASAATQALIAERGFRVLRPTLDLRYLDATQVAQENLARDLDLLGRQAPQLAQVIGAYDVLRRERARTSSTTRRAAQIIADAWPTLPGTEQLSKALEALPLKP